MGGTHGKPTSSSIPGLPEGSSSGSSSGGCPIKGRGKSSSSSSPSPPPHPAVAAAATAAQSEGGCPVKRAGNKTGTVYNVYAQPIDPTNQMPATANQQKAPGQTQSLSTDRVASHIPKGGTEAETWTYPSPQMFWNALTRKGKAEGAKEEDMEVVVAIHNNMNEKTWHKVMEWEALHASPEGGEGKQLQAVDVTNVDARLSRFLGRPDDISPKAWIKSLFGHPLPFDRHDWVVQRADGTEVRYIIDYYHDDVAAKDNQVPRLHDFESVKSISVDVRPALDSIGAVVDRGVRMPFSRRFAEAKNPFEPLPFFWKGNPVPAGEEEAIKKRKAAGGGKEGEEKMDLMELSKQVHNSCAEHFVALQSCKDEASCSKAAVGLTYCMASMLCKDEAKAFDVMLEKSAGNDKHQEAIEATFNRMRTCLDDFEKKARKSAGKD